MQTLPQVIEALEKEVDKQLKLKSRQSYFALLYLHMTRAVYTGIQQGVFEDNERMERFDVHFAKRYLDAANAFESKNDKPTCWHSAFTACGNPNITVIQHLLLGINAHINYDLAIAAAKTAPYHAIHSLENDFNTINDLIADLAESIQIKLSKIWWPMRFITQITKGKEDAVINFSIEKARKTSWLNAVALAQLDDNQALPYASSLDNTVFEIGKRIITPNWVTRVLLAPVRWFEEKDVVKVATILNENPA